MIVGITFSQPGPKDRLLADEVEALMNIALAQHDLTAARPPIVIWWTRSKDFQPGRLN